jgi:hypothetical protein
MTATQFFCAESSRQAGIDIIGSASTHEIYIAIECPTPWAADDLNSTGVPPNLRQLGEEIYDDYDRFQTRLLLIYNESLKDPNFTRILIFRKVYGFANGYSQQGFHVADIEQVAPLIKDYLTGHLTTTSVESATRDFLICTHGSHDKCCAKYGNPFYRQALTTVAERTLDRVRVWQASHIGGHRFAPTAIDFPTGRYYGYFDQTALVSILTRTGEIQCLKSVYRGWGMLPWAAQVLEKELMLMHGWQWFDYKVTAQVLEHDEEEMFNRVELSLATPANEQQIYTADIVADVSKTVYLKGSCSSKQESEVTPYIVKNLAQIQ